MNEQMLETKFGASPHFKEMKDLILMLIKKNLTADKISAILMIAFPQYAPLINEIITVLLPAKA